MPDTYTPWLLMELIHWRHIDIFHRSRPGGKITCSWHWIILLVTQSLAQFIHSQNSQCHGCYNKWWGCDNIRQLHNGGWKLCHDRVIFHAGWNAIKSIVMMQRDKLPVCCFCEERGRKQPGTQLITQKKLMQTNGLQEFTSDNITWLMLSGVFYMQHRFFHVLEHAQTIHSSGQEPFLYQHWWE